MRSSARVVILPSAWNRGLIESALQLDAAALQPTGALIVSEKPVERIWFRQPGDDHL